MHNYGWADSKYRLHRKQGRMYRLRTQKVIVVVGANKIVADAAEGIKRAKSVAPMNSKRIHHNNPCDETCRCEDCTGEMRVCNVISIIDGCYKFPGRISVVVVGEELGF